MTTRHSAASASPVTLPNVPKAVVHTASSATTVSAVAVDNAEQSSGRDEIHVAVLAGAEDVNVVEEDVQSKAESRQFIISNPETKSTTVTARHAVASTAPRRFKSNARAAVHSASSATRVSTLVELKAKQASGKVERQVAVLVEVEDVEVAVLVEVGDAQHIKDEYAVIGHHGTARLRDDRGVR